ncbi:MAG: hypothetical protein L0Z47_06205 [Actinobacteria bacterium]|nr:hypothetical protein [Actinomycetota bacterium]
MFLVNASSTLVARCMIESGWDYKPQQTTEGELFGGTVMERHELWLYDDPTRAAEVGYGIAQSQVREPSADEPLDLSMLTQQQQDEYFLDLFGSDEERIEITTADGSTTSLPGGGCLGEARRAIFVDIAEYLRVRDYRGSLAGIVWEQVMSSGALQRALRSWSSCMSSRGFETPDPDAALDLALEGISEPNGTALEREVATADVDCKRESGLSDAFALAFTVSVDDVMAGEELSIQGALEFDRMALERAREALRILP